jgi:preprotein translocase subunit SecD
MRYYKVRESYAWKLSMKRSRRRWLILLILIVTALSSVAVARDYSFRFLDGTQEIKVRQGLDLQGGSHLVYEVDFGAVKDENLSDKDKNEKLTNLRAAIERRVNAFGVAETNVQTARSGDSYRIIVDLPGVKDIEAAKSLIGQTAQLKFWEITPTGEQKETGISGNDLARADADFQQSPTGGVTNVPIINFSLKGDATKRFGELTTRLNREGGKLLTTLDEEVLYGPADIRSPITGGQGQLEGGFADIKEAERIAELLNAGALPVPIKGPVEERTVGPTLGQESIERSIIAGILGLVMVSLFMVGYYRLPGLVAVLALGIYSLITFAIFKGGLFWLGLPPVTLTLAGVAGFILSIGMAVDANVLIFERLKEELRSGRPMSAALEAGFKRAWTSIRDSNVATLITTAILFSFGTGPIKGFALTLAIGVVVSMFSAITVTRTLLSLVLRPGFAHRLWLFGVRDEEVKPS